MSPYASPPFCRALSATSPTPRMARCWVKTGPTARRLSGLVLTRLPKPCDKLRDRAEERLGRPAPRIEAWCVRRTLLVGGRRPHREVIAQDPGQAEEEGAPEGQPRTADRLAEKAGARRVFVPLVLAGRLLLRVSASLPIRGR